MSVAILIVAAGRGERLGYSVPKAFVPLAGKPLLLHTLESLHEVPEVDALIPVIAKQDIAHYEALCSRISGEAFTEERKGSTADAARLPKLCAPVFGGAERQDSVRAGLASLGPEVSIVLVHDAARPLVQPADVSKLIAVVREHGAAILATPLRDTVKRVCGSAIVETPPRHELYAAQTPQGFQRALFEEAMAQATREGFLGTDDAQLVERLPTTKSVKVQVVEGSAENIKITLPSDLAFAEICLQHRTAEAREKDFREKRGVEKESK